MKLYKCTVKSQYPHDTFAMHPDAPIGKIDYRPCESGVVYVAAVNIEAAACQCPVALKIEYVGVML